MARLPNETKEVLKSINNYLADESPSYYKKHRIFCWSKSSCSCPKVQYYQRLDFALSDRIAPGEPPFHVSGGVWERHWDTVSVSEFQRKSGVTLWQPLDGDLYAWTRTSEGYTGNVGGAAIKTSNGLGRIQWNAEKTVGTLFQVTN